MSDGPHKSLKMSRAWRNLAKHADKDVYCADDVSAALPTALSSDWKNEISSALLTAVKEVFLGKSNSLHIREIAIDQLSYAESLAVGSVFGEKLLSWSKQLIQEGKMGITALHEAVGCAALDRTASRFRQVEEHYLRESSERRATAMRSQLNKAAMKLSAPDMGEKILSFTKSNRSREKKRSLDQGPPL